MKEKRFISLNNLKVTLQVALAPPPSANVRSAVCDDFENYFETARREFEDLDDCI
jgi:hypothetical protein